MHLALRNGDEAVYVEKIEGGEPYRMASRVGPSAATVWSREGRGRSSKGFADLLA